MPIFQMVKYHKQQYPSNIPLNIEETAGHFDIKAINVVMDYSLHTEYSYGKRDFTCIHLEGLDSLLLAHKKSVPQLWKNDNWAREFAKFIIRSTANIEDPKIIEIHPPFDDYTSNIQEFVDRYRIFEEMICEKFPNTEIHIENRCGSVYNGGKFLISKVTEISDLCELIEKEQLKLKIAFDIPQLYTAHGVTSKKLELTSKLLDDAMIFRQYIGGVHLWGKGLSQTGRKIAHFGDLNSYFNNEDALKQEFLQSTKSLFSDGLCRNLVLEVNSNNSDLLSIIDDLDSVGFTYK